MHDKNLRMILITCLDSSMAHVSVEQAIEGLKPALRNKKPAKDIHSVWELLEHIRIGQEDLLKYMIDPNWTSPKWPEEYWPKDDGKVSDEQWNECIKGIKADLDEMILLINNDAINLTSIIPHTKEHTYLREILLAIDHTSYHVGQIVQARKMLGNWE